LHKHNIIINKINIINQNFKVLKNSKINQNNLKYIVLNKMKIINSKNEDNNNIMPLHFAITFLNYTKFTFLLTTGYKIPFTIGCFVTIGVNLFYIIIVFLTILFINVSDFIANYFRYFVICKERGVAFDWLLLTLSLFCLLNPLLLYFTLIIFLSFFIFFSLFSFNFFFYYHINFLLNVNFYYILTIKCMKCKYKQY